MKVLFCIAALVSAAVAIPIMTSDQTFDSMVGRWGEHGEISFKDPALSEMAVTDELVEKINKAGATWKAGKNPRFEGMSLLNAKKMMGVLKDSIKRNLPVKTSSDIGNATLPDQFDWRVTMGDKCPSLKEIRDQSSCGSCWAFGAVEAMTDRICIHSKGAKQARLSAEDVVSCDGILHGEQGCSGGIPAGAWQYYQNTGVVTGGENGDNSLCYPYALPKCAHHINGSKYGPCPEPKGTPKCTKKCVNGDSWLADKHHGASTYNLKGVDAMMQEIYTNGPIEGMFFVFQDFLAYKSGVYSRSLMNFKMLGGHAIKIMGWGTEGALKEKYWLVANSWNEQWGDNGYFKIKRDAPIWENCGIESAVINGGPVAGLPKL